jgi:hypothetical protein
MRSPLPEDDIRRYRRPDPSIDTTSSRTSTTPSTYLVDAFADLVRWVPPSRQLLRPTASARSALSLTSSLHAADAVAHLLDPLGDLVDVLPPSRGHPPLTALSASTYLVHPLGSPRRRDPPSSRLLPRTQPWTWRSSSTPSPITSTGSPDRDDEVGPSSARRPRYKPTPSPDGVEALPQPRRRPRRPRRLHPLTSSIELAIPPSTRQRRAQEPSETLCGTPA